MLEAIVIIALLALLLILFVPRRGSFVRNVTSTRNGQPYWRDQEPY